MTNIAPTPKLSFHLDDIEVNSARSRVPTGKYVEKGEVKRGCIAWVLAHKILCLFLIAGILGGYFYAAKLFQLKSSGLQIGVLDPFKGALSAIAPGKENAIDKLEQTDGKTNILLLGIDARGNNDTLLTDSMMMLSYDHQKKEVAQISFPRDLAVRYKVNNQNYDDKLNSIFPVTYSVTKSYEKSFKNLGDELEQISGLKPHYGMMINFQGFKKIIDTLGGVDVNVENSFCDAGYPGDKPGTTMIVQFKQGTERMNGTRALQYARSRIHNECNPANNGTPNFEGSDFMRARRQQKVMNAVKEKIISANLFTKVDTLNSLIANLGESVRFYNIGGDELDTVIKSRDVLKNAPMFSMVVDPTLGGTINALLIGADKQDGYGYRVLPVVQAKTPGVSTAPTVKTTGVKDFDYSVVRELIKFYQENSFLLVEKAQTEVVWTNAKRYNDFLKVKKYLELGYVEYEANEAMVRVALAQSTRLGQVDSETVTPTVKPRTSTPTSISNVPFVTVYKLSDSKSKTLDYIQSLITSEDKTTTIKTSSDLPKELERLAKGKDFLVVVE